MTDVERRGNANGVRIPITIVAALLVALLGATAWIVRTEIDTSMRVTRLETQFTATQSSLADILTQSKETSGAIQRLTVIVANQQGAQGRRISPHEWDQSMGGVGP